MTSAAFNSGTNLASLGVTQDIRGLPRPQGRYFDRGAYERYVPPSGTVFTIR
jgi:hypothetical protein